MRKRKITLLVLSLVLSCVFVAGCAKSQYLSIGKTKYDAVLFAMDNYAVAVEKGKTYVYKDGKKLNASSFYEVRPIEEYAESQYLESSYVTDAVIVTSALGEKPQLMNSDGAIRTYEYEITGIKAYTVKDGLRKRTAGFIANLDDGKKVAITPKTLAMSSRYDDIIFRNGYFFGVTRNEDETTGVITVNYSLLAERESGYETVFSVDNQSKYGFSTDVITGKSLVWYQNDSAGGMYSYAVAADYEIAENCSKPESIGGGYFTYEKSGEDGTYIINPKNESELNASYAYAFESPDLGKVYIAEENASAKTRIKELVSGNATEYYDEVMLDEDTGIMAACSGDEKTIFFDKDFNKITEFGIMVEDADIVAYPEFTNIVAYGQKANGEERIFAYVNGTLTDRANNYDDVEFYDGTALVQKDGETSLWVPYTNAVISLGNGGINAIGNDGNFYSLATTDGMPWVVHKENLKFLDGGRTDSNNVASLFGITAENFNSLGFYTGSLDALDITNKTKYEVSLSGIEKFGRDNVIQVDYIGYTKDGKTQTVLAAGTFDKKFDYTYIGEKAVVNLSSGMQSGGSLFTVANGNGSASKKDVYSVKKTDGGIEIKPVIENVSSATVTMDMFGEYILVDVNGKTAVYDDSGKLLLNARYNVEGINNGLVLVSAGEKYGLVKLGKTANKAKLVQKIEYDEIMLMTTGDYIAQKGSDLPSVYNKDGKCIAKNVVLDFGEMSANYMIDNYENNDEMRGTVILNFADGSAKLMETSVKQSNINVNLFIYAMLSGIMN